MTVPVLPEAQLRFDALLRAVEENQYDAFIAPGNPTFQKGITRETFASVSGKVAPLLKAGYEVLYLGQMEKAGHDIYLWRIKYADSGDDTLAHLALREGLVGGFWLT